MPTTEPQKSFSSDEGMIGREPAPTPRVPGGTEFDNAVRAMLNISKQDVLKEEGKRKKVDTEAR